MAQAAVSACRIAATSPYRFVGKRVARKLGTEIFPWHMRKFPEGEMKVVLDENPSRQRFVLFATASPGNVHRSLWEIAALASTLRHHGAAEVTLVMGYLPYVRQDRVDEPGTSTSTSLVATFLKHVAGIDRLVTFDLHNDAIEALYQALSIPMVHLSARALFARNILERSIEARDRRICFPDRGREKFCIELARDISGGKVPRSLVVGFNKQRVSSTRVRVLSFRGNVRGRTVFMADDQIGTAGTALTDGEYLKRHNAKEVVVMATHPLLVRGAARRLEDSRSVGEVVVTNTIGIPRAKRFAKLKVISLVPTYAYLVSLLFSGNEPRMVSEALAEFMLKGPLEYDFAK